MEKTLLFFNKVKIAGFLFIIGFSNSYLAAQSDTLIIGYKDGTTHIQKAILPSILNMQTVDSLLVFNQYKYVLPDMIDINALDISDSLRVALLSEFGYNQIFDGEEKKRLASRTSKEKLADAEGMDLNLEIELTIKDNYTSECGKSYCIDGVLSPISDTVCNLSVVNNRVKIAVLDTGVDPSLTTSAIYDCVKYPNAMPIPGPTNDYHFNYHGTKVAEEIIAASCCSDSTELIPIRILNRVGQGFLWDMLKGIAIAISQDVCIINISAGFTDETNTAPGIKRPLDKATEIAGYHNILVITSAGNATEDNDLLPHFPSNYSFKDNVIAVGSSCDGTLESYSNFGQTMVTLTTEGAYSLSEHGTSYAAAGVSGFASLLQLNAPVGTFCDPIAIKEIMVENVNNTLPNTTAAGGELMPYETLVDWLPAPPPPPPIPIIKTTGGSTNQNMTINEVPKIYPSPFIEEFYIELVLETEALVDIFVTNLNGQLIAQIRKEGRKNMNNWIFNDLALHAPGIYMLQIKSNGNSYNQKIVKL